MAVIKSTGYNIVIGKSALTSLSAFLVKKRYHRIFILCDENTLQHCLPILVTSCLHLKEADIIEVESGEASKSFEFSEHILQTLIENKADKNTLILNLGGGVISDLGGFNAAIYKRGIDFINVPTSLLAMTDASVGGKTGIDFAGVKNVVGTFAQPQAVFIYPEFLKSLPERHYKNGLAEIFKIALIADEKFWQALKKDKYTFDVLKLINTSVSLKNAIVQKDPFDKAIRKSLNFGHSIGHALESILLGSEFELLHGEAIVIGMVVESQIAFQKKLISKRIFTEISELLISVFQPVALPELDMQLFLHLLHNDKKNLTSGLQFSLPDKIGSCKINTPVTEAQVNKGLIHYKSLLA